MTTKINKLKKLYNMQPHKAKKLVELLDENLPNRGYVNRVLDKTRENDLDVSETVIKEVRNFRTKNLIVLDLIVEFALEHKASRKRIEKAIQ